MKRYLLQYQRNADEIVQEDDLDAESNNKMISELNLATSGYSMVSGHRPPDKTPWTNPRAKTPRTNPQTNIPYRSRADFEF